MNILYIVHNLSPEVPGSESTVMAGGCETFTYQLAHGLSLENNCYILYPDLINKEKLYLHKISKFRNSLEKEYEAISRRKRMKIFTDILTEYKIDLIHYQHLIHSPLEMTAIGKARGIKQVLSIHDYYYVCEEHFLENDKYVPCDIPTEISECAKCLYNKSKIDPIDVIKRREVMTCVLEDMDLLLVPDKSVRSNYFRIFSEMNDKIKIAPLGIRDLSLEEVPTDLPELRIGIQNYLTYIKGWIPMLNTIKICESMVPEVKFVFLCDNISKDNYNLLIKFKNVEINPHATENLSLRWIPSIAKETFSLIASEGLLRGTPLLCPDQGAFSNRLSEKEAYLYQPLAEVSKIAELIESIHKDRDTLKQKVDYIKDNRERVPLIDYSVSQHEVLYSKLLTK